MSFSIGAWLRSIMPKISGLKHERFCVTLGGAAGGIGQEFRCRADAIKFFEARKEACKYAYIEDNWSTDSQNRPKKIAEYRMRPKFMTPKEVSVAYRHGLPNSLENAFGTVLSKDHLPYICGHGGSAWLCPSCAKKILSSDKNAINAGQLDSPTKFD